MPVLITYYFTLYYACSQWHTALYCVANSLMLTLLRCLHNTWQRTILLTSLAVQFYVGLCSKSGALAARLASGQCLCLSSSTNDNQRSDKTV